MAILLAGGAGYIGSHTAVTLLEAGYDVVVADNFCNSCPEMVRRVEELTGRSVPCLQVDVSRKDQLLPVFQKHDVECVIHFAGLKAVGESVEKPLAYYRNNLDTTLCLLECMAEAGVNRIIFSSSATVYGAGNPVPYLETMSKGLCTNPYGWTKSMIEQILMDASAASPELSVVLLRYFNPVGAHESGRIGEDPCGRPNNLMPYITQVAVGRLDHLTIFGGDYPTPDGTCRRDYIHVMDLADGHVRAVEYAARHAGCEVFNLGTGTPYSVLEMVAAFERSTGVPVKHVMGPRREGDLAECWANADKALQVLGWRAGRGLEDMCRDAWNWQRQNPLGCRTARPE